MAEARPPRAGCCCPQATRGQVGLPASLPTAGDECLQPPSSAHRTGAAARAQGISKGCPGSKGCHQLWPALPRPPDPHSSSSPSPELTLGLRAPPTLLSTSSGGKSTITHISSPGTLAQLGGVTHVTSFSHASPGSRGGYSIKVSPSSPHQPHHPSSSCRLHQGVGLAGFLYSIPPPQHTRGN